LQASKTVGGDAEKHAALVANTFAAQREFLVVAAKSKNPGAAALGGLLGDTSKALQAVTEFREQNRRSTQPNHLSAVSEGIQALAWVTISPKPAPHVKEMIGACQFYSNRVLKDFKESDPNQVAWAKSFVQVLEDLYEYVKSVHTTGVAWNPRGGEASAPAAAAASAAPAGPPPAPVAPPPLIIDESAPAAEAAAPEAAARAGLFAALNQAGDSGFKLKKVEKSEMTHKNPALRGSSVVPAEIAPKAAAPAGPAKATPKSPPVFELRDKKWVVEFQENAQLVIEHGDIRQTVYIYKCVNTTITIKGKVNSITCDSCKKSGVVFDDCIGSFEFVNCQSMQVQVVGNLPIISIDKTDGAQVFLSQASLGVSIITAKSSEMNIVVPTADGSDFTEHPVPEQYKTTFDPATKKLVTTINEIAG